MMMMMMMMMMMIMILHSNEKNLSQHLTNQTMNIFVERVNYYRVAAMLGKRKTSYL